jgi:hypothetical protein
MTTPLTFLANQSLDRRNLIKGAAALAATAVTERGLCGDPRAIGPIGFANHVNGSAALGTAIRKPLSGFSFGVCQAQAFVRTKRFPGLRRHHGG